MFVEIFILIMNISISTAHNVDIDYIPAGVLDRILATLIDGSLSVRTTHVGSHVYRPFQHGSLPDLVFRHSCGDHRFLSSILRGRL